MSLIAINNIESSKYFITICQNFGYNHMQKSTNQPHEGKLLLNSLRINEQFPIFVPPAIKKQNFDKVTEKIHLPTTSKYQKHSKKSDKPKLEIYLQEFQGDVIKNISNSTIKSTQMDQIWSNQLGQKMLDMVAIGLKWKEIAKKQQFKKFNIRSKTIKTRFQCFIRFKFNILFKNLHRKSKLPDVSDVIYKLLLQQSNIEKYYTDGKIYYQEKQTLKKSTKFFKIYNQFKDNKLCRNLIQKKMILNQLQSSLSIQLIVNTVIKLNQLKKNKNKYKSNEAQLVFEEQERTFSTEMKTDYNNPLSIDDNFDGNYTFNENMIEELSSSHFYQKDNCRDQYGYLSLYSCEYPFGF